MEVALSLLNENGAKSLPNTFPAQSWLPRHLLAPWHPPCGPKALAESPGIWARPARKRFHPYHVTVGNRARSSPFKQHPKYSLGEPAAKYGLARELSIGAF